MASKYLQGRNAIQIALIAALFHTAAPCLNLTESRDLLDPSAIGTSVVQRVVSKLHSLQLVTCNSYRLLRRIALVETEDGVTMKRDHGGIWALNDSKFINIKTDVEKVVRNELCLGGVTTYSLLNKPLISGLAASVYLTYLENNNIRIPLAGYYIEEQAQFWKDYYHSRNLTEDDFVNQVESFERQTACQVDITQESQCPMATECLNKEDKKILFNESQTGSEVVQAVISKLYCLQILTCDHRLLRRIALVETNDGINDVPGGGIWALNKSKFNDVASDVEKVLRDKLCLTTPDGGVSYTFLRHPFVSGLAAGLYLNFLQKIANAHIPLARHIWEQAHFWMKYYHSRELTAKHFMEQVKTRELQKQVDLTLEDDVSGSEVVEMVIAKISKIFDSDHRLLRRIAYVETDDGTSGVPPGGIWAVDEPKLKTVLTKPELVELHEEIDQEFEIEFNATEFTFLGKPLVSGLVARLYLYYLEIVKGETIPLAAAIGEQAQFWYSNYYSGAKGLAVDDFKRKVTNLEKREGCLVNADIFFVLDVSASIKPTNFTKVKQFEHNFVKNIVVGPNDNQVGTIIFDHDADIVFKLNSCSNTSCALKEIDNIPYRSQFTNVKDALCRLVEGFNESNGARPLSRALFRIAIVMTDGVSNHYHSTCGWDTIEEAAAAVHALKVLVYVIGVGHFDDKELRAIASPVPGAVAYLPDFDLYPQRWEQTFDDVCKRASQAINTDEEVNVTLAENKTIRYNFLIPVIGVTVKVCITGGHIRAYGSVSIPNPNSAFNDFFIELDYENDNDTCGHAYVEPCATSSLPSRSRRQTSRSHTNNQIVYVSIEARDKDSSFAVDTITGDVYRDVNNGSTPESSETNDKKLIIAVTSSLLLLLSCLLIIGIVGGTVYHYKKKKKQKTLGEDEYHLLPQDDDTIEF